jgi:hypothetical protein
MKMRLSEHMVLIDIMSQQFHSYADVIRSAIRQLANPIIYTFRKHGYHIPHGSDYPKQAILHALITQAPEHLAKLM